MNKQTGNEYYVRLSNFERFILSKYGSSMNLDSFVKGLKDGKFDIYETLADYCVYLQDSNIHTSTLKQRVVTAKNFFEFNDIDISPRRFKIKVRLPKDIKRNKEAIDKNDIVNILNGCSDIKLKTYVMLLASTGMRAVEALSIRLKDLDIESSTTGHPPTVTIKGEYTKTKVDRYVFLTREMADQLAKWVDFKYRTRRICYKDEKTGEMIDEYRTPNRTQNDLVFSVRNYNISINSHKKNNDRSPRSKPQNSYYGIVASFDKTIDRIGMGSREEESNNENKRGRGRRKITLHSFRRFVKTTISDLGYADYSEWFIGHAGSVYWKKKDSEKADIFKKIEPYLTFLNVPQLERQGADLQTKIEELHDVNQLLRYKQNEKEEQIKKLEESVAFLADKFNAFLASQPGNKILYDDENSGESGIKIVKGIELKPEIKNKAIGKVMSSSNGNNKKK
jgi:integrase